MANYSHIDRRKLAELEPESYVMEYQVESERGLLLMGTTIFSEDALTAIDPAHFTSLNGKPLGQSLNEYEIPDNTWTWLWSRWYVDMSADVDDQGWCYSWRFRSKHWRGYSRFLRSFVRQRLWLRPRIKKDVLERLLLPTEELEINSSKSESEDKQAENDPLYFMRSCRNDRERIEKVERYVANEDGFEFIKAHKQDILNALMFQISREDFNRLYDKLSAEFQRASN